MCETVTSYTVASIVENECLATIRNALIQNCIEMIPLDGSPCFTKDPILNPHCLGLGISLAKNKNKSLVAERAIQKLEEELLCKDPSRGSVSPITLSVAVAILNSCIRHMYRSMSAREMWTHKDQFTNSQLPLSDREVIFGQHDFKKKNAYSQTSKASQHKLPSLQFTLVTL